MEYETTVSLVFGGDIFQEIYRLLYRRSHVKEDLDVYNVGKDKNKCGKVYRYRELKRFDSNNVVTTLWDRKAVNRVVETQVPYINTGCGRVIFVSATYKSSFEDTLTEVEWKSIVHEDHSNNTCVRVANKHRLSFPPGSFIDLYDGRVPLFTRLSLGEYSTYGGTLEARTKCNPVYYLEIENETKNEPENVDQQMVLLVEVLFKILPYETVARAMRRDTTLQRECVDNIFDEFKRRFVNYNRYRDNLWKAVGKKNARWKPPIKLFLMPKWDGIKATANYCDGFLFVKDACGSLSTYKVDLPFDNDLMLQLEVVEGNGKNFLVVTEIMAVIVKNHNTLYHVYSRNNTLSDTGRYAGNVSTSITLKTQFKDSNHVCNTYRLVAPVYSLLVMHYLSMDRWRRFSLRGKDYDSQKRIAPSTTPATNLYMRSDRLDVIVTTVVVTGHENEIKTVLRLLDCFHGYKDGKRVRPSSGQEDRTNRTECLQHLSAYLPPPLLQDRRFYEHCEGLLLAFIPSGGARRHRIRTEDANSSGGPLSSLPDHGYFKLKVIDTVDLEYCVSLGIATSASNKHHFQVHGVPKTFAGWSERPTPITNDRVIIECCYDRDENRMVFFKDRPDKNKADNDAKIFAIDSDIIEKCRATQSAEDHAKSVHNRCHQHNPNDTGGGGQHNIKENADPGTVNKTSVLLTTT